MLFCGVTAEDSNNNDSELVAVGLVSGLAPNDVMDNVGFPSNGLWGSDKIVSAPPPPLPPHTGESAPQRKHVFDLNKSVCWPLSCCRGLRAGPV
jgi:hypothetical protein